MTIVKIFLASSLEELKMDRVEISDFIRALNDRFLDRGGYFRLFTCENEDIAMADGRKQEEYNAFIRDSELFVILFFKKAGEYTIEEFNVALEQFRKSKAPAILTFFRQDGTEPTEDVRRFMTHLDQELGHYFKLYSDVDAMKLYILMQILGMKLDLGAGAIEFKDGKAYVCGSPLLTLDSLPELMNNQNVQRLHQEYHQLEQEFLDAKASFLADPQDEADFLGISMKKNKVQKEFGN